jgi:hypothetical protein
MTVTPRHYRQSDAQLSRPVLTWIDVIVLPHESVQQQTRGQYLHVTTKKNSLVLVRERTIRTKRLPLVSEVIANFLPIEVAAWSA